MVRRSLTLLVFYSLLAMSILASLVVVVLLYLPLVALKAALQLASGRARLRLRRPAPTAAGLPAVPRGD